MDKRELLDRLRREGFSKKIIDAFEKVKREEFIPNGLKDYAYENEPLPIGYGQTISQPYTIAFMLNLLELRDNLKILEIGSGSGYVLALINEISKNSRIYGIERIKGLVDKSRRALREEKNIIIVCGDGSRGLRKHAPYDRILISASAKKMPEHLYSQLKDDGIIVASVGNSIFQIKKKKNKIEVREFPGFVFVPLIED